VFDVREPDGWKSLHKVLSIMRKYPACKVTLCSRLLSGSVD